MTEEPANINEVVRVRSTKPIEYWREMLDKFISERKVAEGKVNSALEKQRFAKADEEAARKEVAACQQNVEDCFKEIKRHELAELQPEV